MSENSLPKLQDFRFHHALTVRNSEVGANGTVSTNRSLALVDVAVEDYWRALAIAMKDGASLLGVELQVHRAEIECIASALSGDRLRIGLRPLHVGDASFSLLGGMFREHRLLAVARIRYGLFEQGTGLSMPLPDGLRQAFVDFEVGEPVTRLHLGSWAELKTDAQSLRYAVFVQEQGVPVEDEWDEADADALHAVLYNRLGQPVATGRLLRGESGMAMIGRMAVDHGVRGWSHGARVLDALIDAARKRGDREVQLHAQQSAVTFYRRRGFAEMGEPFDEVGIPHQSMRLVF